jgi:hypothetical protein
VRRCFHMILAYRVLRTTFGIEAVLSISLPDDGATPLTRSRSLLSPAESSPKHTPAHPTATGAASLLSPGATRRRGGDLGLGDHLETLEDMEVAGSAEELEFASLWRPLLNCGEDFEGAQDSAAFEELPLDWYTLVSSDLNVEEHNTDRMAADTMNRCLATVYDQLLSVKVPFSYDEVCLPAHIKLPVSLCRAAVREFRRHSQAFVRLQRKRIEFGERGGNQLSASTSTTAFNSSTSSSSSSGSDSPRRTHTHAQAGGGGGGGGNFHDKKELSHLPEQVLIPRLEFRMSLDRVALNASR